MLGLSLFYMNDNSIHYLFFMNIKYCLSMVSVKLFISFAIFYLWKWTLSCTSWFTFCIFKTIVLIVLMASSLFTQSKPIHFKMQNFRVMAKVITAFVSRFPVKNIIMRKHLLWEKMNMKAIRVAHFVFHIFWKGSNCCARKCLKQK